MKTEAAQCAAMIRKELKQAFPNVKFSVTSDTFSMGDAVRIRWEDGPKVEAVDAITGKYQYGHFDGMIDMYENSNCRSDIPQVKYVQTNRNMSARSEALAEELLKSEYGVYDDQTSMAFFRCWFNAAKWRLFCGTL